MTNAEQRIETLEHWQGETNTRIALVERDVKTMKQRLEKIESNTTWAVRLISGAIVLGILAYVFNIPV